MALRHGTDDSLQSQALASGLTMVPTASTSPEARVGLSHPDKCLGVPTKSVSATPSEQAEGH